jgi:hypothetical protein
MNQLSISTHQERFSTKTREPAFREMLAQELSEEWCGEESIGEEVSDEKRQMPHREGMLVH